MGSVSERKATATVLQLPAGAPQMGERAAQPAQLPDDQHVARPELREACLRPRAVVPSPRGAVPVKVALAIEGDVVRSAPLGHRVRRARELCRQVVGRPAAPRTSWATGTRRPTRTGASTMARRGEGPRSPAPAPRSPRSARPRRSSMFSRRVRSSPSRSSRRVDGMASSAPARARDCPVEDTRHDYGEPRFITVGVLDGRVVVVVWTPRGAARRVMSMASTREQRLHDPRRAGRRRARPLHALLASEARRGSGALWAPTLRGAQGLDHHPARPRRDPGVQVGRPWMAEPHRRRAQEGRPAPRPTPSPSTTPRRPSRDVSYAGIQPTDPTRMVQSNTHVMGRHFGSGGGSDAGSRVELSAIAGVRAQLGFADGRVPPAAWPRPLCRVGGEVAPARGLDVGCGVVVHRAGLGAVRSAGAGRRRPSPGARRGAAGSRPRGLLGATCLRSEGGWSSVPRRPRRRTRAGAAGGARGGAR